MSGVEATLHSTGMRVRRMTHQELFLEIKRALNPLSQDTVPLMPPEKQLMYDSARSQAANVNVEDEADDHLKIGSLLYSLISLKDLPDATFPGMLRELLNLPFPLVVNLELTLPDQAKVQKQFKSRLRKMMAAQRDMHGGFRLNVDAQVAEEQLVEVLKKVISSSLKVCEASLIIGVRTSKPIWSRVDREEAERTLSDRRQSVLHALARMNGARGIPEMLAQKRLYFGSLPAMGSDNKREIPQLTLHAADLLPTRSSLARHPTLTVNALRDAAAAVDSLLALRPLARGRQHADHGEERRREDLHGPDVPAHAGAGQSPHFHPGKRRFLSASCRFDVRALHRR